MFIGQMLSVAATIPDAAARDQFADRLAHKARITEAVVEAVATEPHFLLRYQCSPYYADSALYPVIQHLGFAAGFAC